MVLDFILIVGGYNRKYLRSVEVASPDPVGQPVPDCKKVLSNFLEGIRAHVGTTIGELKENEKTEIVLYSATIEYF